MRHTEDDRGQSYWDVFEVLPGQVNISITKPGQKRGFHLHKNKTDYWFVLSGEVLVVQAKDTQDAIFDTESRKMKAGDSLEIAPGIWHAYQNIGEDNATLVYYETAKSGVSRDDDYELSLDIYEEWQ